MTVKSYEHINECRDWSSEVVALFLADWELGRVAWSCHMAHGFLSAKKMRDACWVSSGSLGPLSLCSQCQSSSLVEWSQQESLLSPWTGCDKKGEGCGERKWKQEGRCDRFFVD